MEALYYLFKTPFILTLILIVSILAWIFVPSKIFNKKKWGWKIILVEIILIVVSTWYLLQPKEFEKNYLKNKVVHSNTIKNLANKRNFYVGVAIENNEELKTIAKQHFNSITLENASKYGKLIANDLKTYDFSKADSLVNFAMENNLRVRGHVLVWGRAADFFKQPNLRVLLKDVPKEKMPDTLNALINSHITTMLNRYKGKITQWEVVNEPLEVFKGNLDDNIFHEYLGRDYIANAFRLAHKLDPTLELMLNEQFFEYDSDRAKSFIKLVKELLADNVPIHSIGIQGHAMFNVPDLDKFDDFIKEIEDLGLRFEITELDARLRMFEDFKDPYQAQGDFYKRYFEIALKSPACTGITIWGISDKYSWFDGMSFFTKPNEPLIFDKEMNPKPAYFGIVGALKKSM